MISTALRTSSPQLAMGFRWSARETEVQKTPAWYCDYADCRLMAHVSPLPFFPIS